MENILEDQSSLTQVSDSEEREQQVQSNRYYNNLS